MPVGFLLLLLLLSVGSNFLFSSPLIPRRVLVLQEGEAESNGSLAFERLEGSRGTR